MLRRVPPIPKLLEIFATVKLCLADWNTALDLHFDTLRPLLVKAVGEVTTTFPSEIGGVRFDVGMRGKRIAAYPVGDDNICMESRWLTVDEIQLWQFDPNKTAAYLGPLNAPHVSNKPTVQVSGDFASVMLPSGRSVSFQKKHKRRAFLRAVARYCRDNQTDILPVQTIIEDHNVALPKGEDSPQALRTNDVMYDLFKGQTDVFLEMFEVLDRAAGHFRLKVTFESS